MYARGGEIVAGLPAGLERADDARLAQDNIYHVREVWPDYDPDAETIVFETADLDFDGDGELPVYVAVHGKRSLTAEEIATRLAAAKEEAAADITDAELLVLIAAAQSMAELRAVLA